MHPFPAEDVDSSGERGGHRWDEHREAAVLELFDDEGGYESICDLDQCRLPFILSAFA
jgi:hypothetical protein